MMVPVETVTIPGVELVRVGTWHGSMDGKPSAVTITAEDLADAVAAATDRNVDAAPLKVGHASPALGDGAPALGWLANVRTSADGTRLVADLTDVPAKFAKLLPKAFRRRSAELAYGLRTPAGKRYRLVVTALSVLGVTPPAVKGLADIESLYGLGSPGLEADHRGATLSAGDLDPAAVEKLAAALDALDALDLDEATQARLAADLEAAAGVTDATIPPPSNVSGQTGADATNRPDEEAR